jgi:hypothetical protein
MFDGIPSGSSRRSTMMLPADTIPFEGEKLEPLPPFIAKCLGGLNIRAPILKSDVPRVLNDARALLILYEENEVQQTRLVHFCSQDR